MKAVPPTGAATIAEVIVMWASIVPVLLTVNGKAAEPAAEALIAGSVQATLLPVVTQPLAVEVTVMWSVPTVMLAAAVA